MAFFLAALLLLEALLLPITIHADVRRHGSTWFRVTARYAFFTRTWQSGDPAPTRTRRQQGHHLLNSLRHADTARRCLLRHVQLDKLDACLLLRTADAARTSLLSGVLMGLARIPTIRQQQVRIRVWPDFFRPHSTLQARCIIRVKMGTILLTMLMLLAFRLRQKARTAYGTSHW